LEPLLYLLVSSLDLPSYEILNRIKTL